MLGKELFGYYVTKSTGPAHELRRWRQFFFA